MAIFINKLAVSKASQPIVFNAINPFVPWSLHMKKRLKRKKVVFVSGCTFYYHSIFFRSMKIQIIILALLPAMLSAEFCMVCQATTVVKFERGHE